MNYAASSTETDRADLERRAAAVMELRRRQQAHKTVYGFYRPTGEYGGELVKCLQEQGGQYVEVDRPPTVSLAEKLEPFLTIPKRFKVLEGGRGSTKSQGVASIAASQAKDYGRKTLCLREMQNTIEDSVHALLVSQIRDHMWTGFEITDKHIKLDGDDVFKFRGLARNSDGVKSMFGFKRAWVEEAQALSHSSLEDLTPTIREADSEIWFTLNPKSSADPISQRFLVPYWPTLLRDGIYEDELHLIIRINYSDNPWHRELESERVHDMATKPKAFYNHKWLGDFNDEVDGSIIPVEWFDAAIDAHVKLGFKPTGAKYVAHDPSDNGADAKGLAYRHGSVFLDVTEYRVGDVNTGCDWATDYACAVDADYFTWDCDGLGVSLRRQISEALASTKVDFQEFKGSMKVDNPKAPYDTQATGGKPKSNEQTFKNKRSQYAWLLRDKFYATFRAVVQGEYIDPDDLVSISSSIKHIDKLRSEVCRIPLQDNNNGLIQIMSKPDMKRLHKIDSPNMFDSMMMTYSCKTHAARRRQVHIPRIPQRRMSR